MDAKHLIPLFGVHVGDPKLEAFLEKAGIKKRPKLARGEDDAHLSFEKEGYELLFVAESALDDDDDDRPIGSGPLVFAGAFFHADGHEDFAEFNGKLPSGLSFNDSRDDVIKKLGKPKSQRGRRNTLRSETWALGDEHKLSVDYADGGKSIELVYCGLESAG